MNVRKPHPYEYLQRTKLGPTNLEIDLLITSTGVASARMSGCPCSPPPRPPSPHSRPRSLCPRVGYVLVSALAGPSPDRFLSLRLITRATHGSRDERLRTSTPIARPRPTAPPDGVV